MVDELDIWRAAKVLCSVFGDKAVICAATQADALLEAGDLDGYSVWRRIVRAIEELQRTHANGAMH